MRIGLDAKRATHNKRGLGNYSRDLIEGLLEYGPQDLELFLYSPPIAAPWANTWLDTLSNKAHIKLPDTILEKTFSTFWRSFLTADDLKKEKLDIFHGLSHEIPYRLGSQTFKKVVTMHDLIFMRYPEFFPYIDRLVYFQKFSYACKHSDMVIAICEQTKSDLIKLLGVDEKKIVVHYQSCSPLFYQTRTKEEILTIKNKYKLSKPFILNVGAFEERKNQLNLLEAYAMIASTIEEDLVLVGQGKKYKEQVKERIIELKLNDRVHILSSVEHRDLPCIYQAAKIFCFPSLFEGFGIPIIEALFSATPVITSLGSCFPESAGEDSIFIDPLSQIEIADSLNKLLGNPTMQDKMRLKGLAFAQRFHRSHSTAQLLNHYRELISLV